VKIPDAVYRRLRDQLWAQADAIGWSSLSDLQKSSMYEEWLRGADVGAVMSRYLDAGSIRVYIKDTIMKPYGRERLKDPRPVLSLLGLNPDEPAIKEFIKPHGRLLQGGRVIAWGLAQNWKSVVFAVFERAHGIRNGIAYAAVLMYPNGRTTQPGERALIEEAGRRLGIEKIIWHDG
jgi:hypothetical protein